MTSGKIFYAIDGLLSLFVLFFLFSSQNNPLAFFIITLGLGSIVIASLIGYQAGEVDVVLDNSKELASQVYIVGFIWALALFLMLAIQLIGLSIAPYLHWILIVIVLAVTAYLDWPKKESTMELSNGIVTNLHSLVISMTTIGAFIALIGVFTGDTTPTANVEFVSNYADSSMLFYFLFSLTIVFSFYLVLSLGKDLLIDLAEHESAVEH